MITEIGIAAGDIWQHLDKKGAASPDELAKASGNSRELILMSLGWLAREGHIALGNAQDGFRASLKEKVK